MQTDSHFRKIRRVEAKHRSSVVAKYYLVWASIMAQAAESARAIVLARAALNAGAVDALVDHVSPFSNRVPLDNLEARSPQKRPELAPYPTMLPSPSYDRLQASADSPAGGLPSRAIPNANDSPRLTAEALAAPVPLNPVHSHSPSSSPIGNTDAPPPSSKPDRSIPPLDMDRVTRSTSPLPSAKPSSAAAAVQPSPTLARGASVSASDRAATDDNGVEVNERDRIDARRRVSVSALSFIASTARDASEDSDDQQSSKSAESALARRSSSATLRAMRGNGAGGAGLLKAVVAARVQRTPRDVTAADGLTSMAGTIGASFGNGFFEGRSDLGRRKGGLESPPCVSPTTITSRSPVSSVGRSAAEEEAEKGEVSPIMASMMEMTREQIARAPRMYVPGVYGGDGGRSETARVLAHILGAETVDPMEDDDADGLSTAEAARMRRRRMRMHKKLKMLREGLMNQAPSDNDSGSDSGDDANAVDLLLPMHAAASPGLVQMLDGGVPDAVPPVPTSAVMGSLEHAASYQHSGPSRGPAVLAAVKGLLVASGEDGERSESAMLAVLSAFRLGRIGANVQRAMRQASPLVSGQLRSKSVAKARAPAADTVTAASGGAPALGVVCIAAATGAVGAVRDLVWIGALDCPNGCSPMYVAAAQRRIDVIKELIRLGATKRVTRLVETSGHVHLRLGLGDVNGPGPFGYTPLHVAAQKGDQWLEVVNLLLEHGADVGARCRFGTTPLLIAASHGHVELVKALVNHVTPAGKRAVDLAATDAAGCTAVRLAVQHDRIDVLAFLTDLQDPPPLDTPDATRLALTPIELAARRGHLKAAQMLLSAGARLSMRALREADAHLTSVRRAAAINASDTAAAQAVTRAEQLVEELRAWADHNTEERDDEREGGGRGSRVASPESRHRDSAGPMGGEGERPKERELNARVPIFKSVSAQKAFSLRPYQRELM